MKFMEDILISSYYVDYSAIPLFLVAQVGR